MTEPIEDHAQVEQPLHGSTANSTAENSQTTTSPTAENSQTTTLPTAENSQTTNSTAENSQTATSPVGMETNSMMRPAKRQKTGNEEDMRGGIISYVLNEDQHKTLLQLERSFPEWPSRQSKEPQYLFCRNKWVAIEAEMRARFPSRKPVKKDTLMRICMHGRKQRELRELQRLKADANDGNQEMKVAMQTLKERCDELKSMLQLEKKHSALLKKQLRQEIEQRMELLQVTAETTEEAEEGDATA